MRYDRIPGGNLCKVPPNSAPLSVAVDVKEAPEESDREGELRVDDQSLLNSLAPLYDAMISLFSLFIQSNNGCISILPCVSLSVASS